MTDFELGKSGRITHPMYLAPGATHYAPVSWDDAFAIVGEELNGLDSPNRAIFYTSGRASNEAAFLYQLFVRQYGTNNLPDCSNMCHESTGTALSEVIGIGKGHHHPEGPPRGRPGHRNRAKPRHQPSPPARRIGKM